MSNITQIVEYEDEDEYEDEYEDEDGCLTEESIDEDEDDSE